ncbi:Fungal specific transcription factor domain containing protein [Hyaloscypha variabilis]
MSASHTSGRKRISQACKPCRNRKVKCDGIYPRCGRCSADATICLFEVSKRNKRLPSPASKAFQATNPSPDVGAQSFGNESASGKYSFPNVTNERASRLLQIFFRHIHPIWPILYKPMYGSADCSQLLATLPGALTNAMMSISVLLDDLEETRLDDLSKQEAAQHFFKRALSLASEDEHIQTSEELLATKPTILRCQVFTILALQQHSIAAFSQAGVLCGVAAAMAIDLQLHRKSETGTSIEVEIKSRLWWSIYVLEKMLSWEMSRPIILRAEEADAPFPSVNESDEFEYSSTPLSPGSVSEALKLHSISSFHTSIRLCMIIEKITRQVYSVTARDKIRSNPTRGEETRLQLWAEIQRWENNLENSPLRLDLSETLTSGPVIVTNYVYMLSTTILLHRPFIEHWNQGSAFENSPAAADPLEVCITSANQICMILEKYSSFLRVLPCDLVFPIFIAANILLRRWRLEGSGSSLIRPRLEQCIQWLNALGKSWKSAEGRQQILMDSLNANPETQAGENSGGPLEVSGFEAGNVTSNDFSNFTSLTLDNDFDLDYMQWITGLEAE